MRRPALLPSIAAPLLVALALACSSEGSRPLSATTATAEPTQAAPRPTETPTSTPSPAATCARAAKSGDTNLLRIVDKQRSLPADFVPADIVAVPDRLAVPGFAGQRMRREAADALVTLLDAAGRAGIELRTRSTYRSYSEQASTFQYWVGRLGEAQARRESAEPGHSEHQLGTVADVVARSVNWELITPFGDTVEGRWLGAHAHEYGFAISYPRDGEAITGYIYEPWHIRYIGPTCSRAWAESGMVLVRFLEVVAAS